MTISTEVKTPKPYVQYLDAITGLIELIGSMANQLEALELQQNANHTSFSHRISAIEKRLERLEKEKPTNLRKQAADQYHGTEP